MVQQTLNLGTTGSVSGGDNLQILFTKSESNFIELYNHVDNDNNPHETTAAQVNAVNINLLAVPNGVATLGSDGILTLSQRPPSSGGAVSLWQPGAPILSEWTPLNIVSGITITQNGTNACVVSVSPSVAVANALTGWKTPVPSTPYTVVFQADCLIGSGACGQNGPANLIFGWIDADGNGLYCYGSAGNLSIYETVGGYAQYIYDGYVSGVFEYLKITLSDNGTNVTFGCSVDGVNSLPLYTTAKSSTNLVDFDNLLIGIADQQNFGQNFTQSYFNFYLYDPNGNSRTVVAPGY